MEGTRREARAESGPIHAEEQGTDLWNDGFGGYWGLGAFAEYAQGPQAGVPGDC